VSVTPDSITQAAASIGLVAGVPAVKSAIGLAEPLTFIAPNIFRLTLQEPVSSDAACIQATGRNGWLAQPRRISDTVIEVLTVDGAGPGIGAFDLVVFRVPLIAPPTSPDPDPLGAPFGSGGISFTPPVYFVTPILPTPPGMYPSVTAAIAAAVLDGYGGPLPTDRALVCVLPGRYADNIVLVSGIDVAIFNSGGGRIGQAVISPLANADVISFTPPAGGDSTNTSVAWSGIDLENGTEPARCVSLLGSEAGRLVMHDCAVRSTTVGVEPIFIANTFAGPAPSLLIASEVDVESDLVPCVLQDATNLADVLWQSCFLTRVDGETNVAYEYDGGAGVQFADVQIVGQVSYNAGGGPQTAICNDLNVRSGGLPCFDLGPGIFNAVVLNSAALDNSSNPVVVGAGATIFGFVLTPTVGGVLPFGTPLVTATGQAFFATAPANWVAPDPGSNAEAINRIAAALAPLVGGMIP